MIVNNKKLKEYLKYKLVWIGIQIKPIWNKLKQFESKPKYLGTENIFKFKFKTKSIKIIII